MSAESPEAVALDLLDKIAAVENKVFHTSSQAGPLSAADREWILNTYAECLTATRGYRKRASDRGARVS